MNTVTLSGTLMGNFTRFGDKNNAVMYTVMTRRGNNNSEANEFTVVTYGNAAEFLTEHAKSGDRLVLGGRISRENMDGVWHTVIAASQVLGIIDGSSGGFDFATATVGGLSDISAVKNTRNGKMFIGINVKAEHTFKQSTFTTYVDVTAWSEVAERIMESQVPPVEGVMVAASGNLIPSTYEDRNGNTVQKVGLWADSVIIGGAAATSSGQSGPTGNVGGNNNPNLPDEAPEGKYVQVADDDLPF